MLRNQICRMLCLGLLILFHSVVSAANFVCPDAEIQKAAEEARLRSARFWTGGPLPGDWYRPCPIRVNSAAHAGCGKTEYQFSGGEVFGWRMTVWGTRTSILRDVIPHEVDHMVRATLLRRPVERWLDEGCAALMESAESHARLRQQAMGIDASQITLVWLSARDYPHAGEDISTLYVLGFSLVEFLLQQQGAETLLAFQGDSGSIPDRLQQYYGLTVETLRNRWADWIHTDFRMTCSDGGCPLHSPLSASPSKPRLTIWTADWCAPCQKLKQDFDHVEPFRRQLQQHYDIEWRNLDRNFSSAVESKISILPTIELQGLKITGYQGWEQLLESLEIPLEATDFSLGNAPEVKRPERPPPRKKSSGDSSKQVRTSPPTQSSDPARRGWTHRNLLPMTWTALQWAGVLGGVVATGGVGGLAVAGAASLIQRRLQWGATHRDAQGASTRERSAAVPPAPFPRDLDEARELLELRQSEGRVATLDTLRGMFLDDELQKLEETGDAEAVRTVSVLRKAIDARIDEVAPLTTTIRE